ncbi:hypothetical protein D9M72_644260 [compost metagenome]
MTDAPASDLRHAFHAPDDAEETIGFANRQIARMQFGKVGPSGQVLSRRGIAHHHIGAAIDEFAGDTGTGNRAPLIILHRQGTTGNGNADPVFIALEPSRGT